MDGLCVPKIDFVHDLETVHRALCDAEQKHGVPRGHFKLVVQIESAAAMINMKDIFEHDRSLVFDGDEQRGRIIAAAFGADDFTADFGVHRSDDDHELDFARKLFALTCAAFDGIVSIDTPYVHFKDGDGLRKELSYLKDIGMKAKFAIHPTQVPIINEELSPSRDEAEYYAAMIKEFDTAQRETGKAAINFRNKMVDIAAYRRAKQLLKRFEAIHGPLVQTPEKIVTDLIS